MKHFVYINHILLGDIAGLHTWSVLLQTECHNREPSKNGWTE